MYVLHPKHHWLISLLKYKVVKSLIINHQFTDINLTDTNLNLVYVRKTAGRKNIFFASVVEVIIKENVLKNNK